MRNGLRTRFVRVSVAQTFFKSSNLLNMKLHLPKGLRTALIAAITFFSSAAATLGSAAYAACFLPPLTDDAGNKAITWKSGSLPNGWKDNLTATGVAAGLNSLNMTAPGWYNFLNNGQNAYPDGGETSLTATGFRFNGRQLYGGEAVIANVSVADILAGTTDNTLTSFTISFDGTAAANGLKFSVWAWDGTEAKSLVAITNIAAGTFDTKTFSASDLNMKETDSIIVS